MITAPPLRGFVQFAVGDVSRWSRGVRRGRARREVPPPAGGSTRPLVARPRRLHGTLLRWIVDATRFSTVLVVGRVALYE